MEAAGGLRGGSGGDLSGELGRDAESQLPGRLARAVRPLPVLRQRQFGGRCIEPVHPAKQGRVLLAACLHPLPQVSLAARHITELHAQRSAQGSAPAHPGGVGGGEVAHQRRQRGAVGGDMVQHKLQTPGLLRLFCSTVCTGLIFEGDQRGAQRLLLAQVEPGGDVQRLITEGPGSGFMHELHRPRLDGARRA